ncbi:MAG: diacylglycerol kinase family protein [Planctomycetes bacterium]|nr:diacylglycerol kinase family protein [Planctomycetota bacterium]
MGNAFPSKTLGAFFLVDADERKKMKRPWKDKFHCAFKGMKLGMRGHSSFFVHFFFASMVVAFAVVLRCDLVEWSLLIGCIGFVLVVELLNSSIEMLYAILPEDVRSSRFEVLDIAAGAVLVASVFASAIGCMVFVPKIIAMLGF